MGSADDKLTRLRWTDLPIGTPIPGAIYDEHSRKQVAKGTVLDKGMIDVLSSRLLFVDFEWHGEEIGEPEADADAPTDGLTEDHRLHERHGWQAEVTVAASDHGHQHTIKVTTQDISQGGFAFLHDQYMYPDTMVVAQFGSGSEKRVVTGVVRYCLHISGKQHRVGVSFVSQQEAPVTSAHPATPDDDAQTSRRSA